MSPDCQRLTLRLVRRVNSTIDSIGFVLWSVRLSRPLIPRRVSVSVSSRPSRSDAAAPGCDRSSSPGELAQAVECDRVVLAGPGPAHARLDGRAVALGQVLEDVAFLVANAALHRHRAEHLVDRGPERLAAIEHDEHALLDIQSAVHEV